MVGATCCEDKEHCCPSDLPICDTDEGRCLPKPVSHASSLCLVGLFLLIALRCSRSADLPICDTDDGCCLPKPVSEKLCALLLE
jgi:hypothetical protein